MYTGCVISSATLLKTLVAPVYEVVESFGCVVILHLIGIVTNPQKNGLFCHNPPSIENPPKLFARNFGKSILGPTLIDRSAFIQGRTELWLGLFDFSGHSAYGNSLKKSITTFKKSL
jgi:hypothetical protein